jgi:hypothetical protein
MMASRGMGAINPSKMPKGKKMARRDDTDFDQYAEGGEVGGDAGDVADLSTESKSGGVRTQMFGGGAGGKGAVGAGGRLNFHKKLSDTSDLSAYIEGNVGKGRSQDLRGRMTGAGVTFTKRFAEGGESKVNEAGVYTKPGMRKSLFESIKAQAVQGTAAGQWSARKAQLLAKKYKAKGGGYKS